MKVMTNVFQEEVDQYLELHATASQINKELEKRRKRIRKHMTDNNMDSVEGTDGKQIYFQQAKASNATSRYTDYELKDVMPLLEGKELRKVTEIKVNADKLHAVMSMLPTETIRALEAVKVTKPGTPRLSVRNIYK